MLNYKCECGWVGHTPKKKSKNRVAFLGCPECAKPVQKYVIPLNRRIGRCGNCGHGGNFNLEIFNHDIWRTCPKCNEIFSVDTMSVVKEGNK